ncbi:hypothetical protein BC830DRAFT_1163843 [Chytriomyces sp. MP71]|nr:hypothetical protein BC830DRAFT_1163843 [Chytriomyces sp. MP71]
MGVPESEVVELDRLTALASTAITSTQPWRRSIAAVEWALLPPVRRAGTRLAPARVTHTGGSRPSVHSHYHHHHGKKGVSSQSVPVHGRVNETGVLSSGQLPNKVPPPQTPPSPQTPNDHRALVRSILSAKPSQREAKSFAIQLTAQASPAAAIKLGLVRIDAGWPQQDLDAFAHTLVAMYKLGLSPIVTIDFESSPSPLPASKQAREALISVLPHRRKRFAAHVPTNARFADVSHALSAMHMRAYILSECSRVAEAIDRMGGRGVPLASGLFTARDDSVVVGEEKRMFGDGGVKDIDVDVALLRKHMGSRGGGVADVVRGDAERRGIPVVAPMATSLVGAVTSVFGTQQSLVCLANAFTALDSPSNGSPSTLPVKVFLLNNKGGGITVKSSHTTNRHISLVNLAQECTDLRNQITSQSELTAHDHRTLKDLAASKQILSILNKTSMSSSAVIACINANHTGEGLISNHLTDKPVSVSPTSTSIPSSSRSVPGSPFPPTVLRTGLTLTTHTSLSTINLTRLEHLLNASFGKSLNTAAFLARLETCLSSITLAGDYQGAVIVTREQPPTPSSAPVYYLDKFAVHPQAQGLGTADILWSQLLRTHSNVCWRSRTANPVNKWYFERSVGNVRFGEDGYWMMFWYGRDGLQRLEDYRGVCAGIEASFK